MPSAMHLEPPLDARPAPVRRRRARRPVRRAVVQVHRWLSFALGLGLLVVTTSGAALVYQPEWTAWTNPQVFDVAATDMPIPVTDALAVVDRAHPDFDAGSVNVQFDLYWVFSADQETHPGFWGVDPRTGAITGFADPSSGFMAFMAQVHECFFTCQTYPGYVAVLADPVPTFGITALADLTWASFLLGSTGLLLLVLAVSGLWLWWPSLAHLSRGFRVRRGKGRYARDFDLHQLVGLVAAPFLLMWGLTGAGFELPVVGTVWYALTGGHEVVEEAPLVSAEAPAGTPDITPAAAARAARAVVGDDPLLYVGLPAADDPTATYSFYADGGRDQFAHGAYPGEVLVAVDRHDPTRTQVEDLADADTVSNRIWDVWGASVLHYGHAVNGWWRVIWFVLGLSPLALAATGISTWLAKRTVRRRREAARAGAAG